jgi:hypothetical protein
MSGDALCLTIGLMYAHQAMGDAPRHAYLITLSHHGRQKDTRSQRYSVARETLGMQSV